MSRFKVKLSLGEKFGLVGILLFIGLWGAVIFGYIANIYKLVAHSPALAQWGAEQIIRIIGIFAAPVGAIAGYF